MNNLKKLIFTGMLFSSSFTFAATSSIILEGAAKVNSTCTVTASNLSFGTITASPTGQSSQTAMVTSICTKETTFNITFDNGASADATDRYMVGQVSSDQLKYNIYKDNIHSEILGNGSNNTVTINDIATGIEQNYPIYGNMLLNQYTTPDNYSDILTITLNY